MTIRDFLARFDKHGNDLTDSEMEQGMECVRKLIEGWDSHSENIKCGIGSEYRPNAGVAFQAFGIMERLFADYDGPTIPGWEGGFAENH